MVRKKSRRKKKKQKAIKLSDEELDEIAYDIVDFIEEIGRKSPLQLAESTLRAYIREYLKYGRFTHEGIKITSKLINEIRKRMEKYIFYD